METQYGVVVTVLLSCFDLSGTVGSLTDLSLNARAAPCTEESGALRVCQSIEKNNKHSRYNLKECRAERASLCQGRDLSLCASREIFSKTKPLLNVWG